MRYKKHITSVLQLTLSANTNPYAADLSMTL